MINVLWRNFLEVQSLEQNSRGKYHYLEVGPTLISLKVILEHSAGKIGGSVCTKKKQLHPFSLFAKIPTCDIPVCRKTQTGTGRQLIPLMYSRDQGTLIRWHSARNLGFIFDEHLTFSDQISSVSKSCYYHIRQLRCIRPYLDTKTASTIATSIVHSKLDY